MKYSDTVQSARCLFLWPLKQPDCEPVSDCDWLNRPRCDLIDRPSISFSLRLHIVCLSVVRMEDSREGEGWGGGWGSGKQCYVKKCFRSRQQTKEPVTHPVFQDKTVTLCIYTYTWVDMDRDHAAHRVYFSMFSGVFVTGSMWQLMSFLFLLLWII